MHNGFDAGLGTGGTIPCRAFFECGQCLQYFHEVSVFIIIFEVFQIFSLCRTPGTVPSFATRDKNLLWVIPNKTSKDGKCLVHNAIASRHLNGTCFIQKFQWCEHMSKAVMKKVGKHSVT